MMSKPIDHAVGGSACAAVSLSFDRADYQLGNYLICTYPSRSVLINVQYLLTLTLAVGQNRVGLVYDSFVVRRIFWRRAIKGGRRNDQLHAWKRPRHGRSVATVFEIVN